MSFIFAYYFVADKIFSSLYHESTAPRKILSAPRTASNSNKH